MGISFAIARILGIFRTGGGMVQQGIGKGIKTPVRPLTVMIFMAGMMMSPESSAEMAASTGAGAAGSLLVQLLLPALLVVAFWVYKSATPGKMVVSAEIVDEKSLGKPSTGQLIVRYIGYYISSFILGLGFLWVAFDKRKQGWHDKIAGTLVVKK